VIGSLSSSSAKKNSSFGYCASGLGAKTPQQKLQQQQQQNRQQKQQPVAKHVKTTQHVSSLLFIKANLSSPTCSANFNPIGPY
jgi:hypothetical protein